MEKRPFKICNVQYSGFINKFPALKVLCLLVHMFTIGTNMYL